VDLLVVFLVNVHVIAYCFLHRCSGDDITSPAVGKLDVEICWRSNVIWLIRVVFVEEGPEVIPYQSGIRFDEDVPRNIRAISIGFQEHVDELVFVQIPPI